MKLTCKVIGDRRISGARRRRKVATCPKTKRVGSKGYKRRKCYRTKSLAKRVAKDLRKAGVVKGARVFPCRTKPTKTAPRGRKSHCVYGRGRGK